MAAPSRTILVVEDDPAVRKFVATTLAGAGFGVTEAGSARDAASAIRAFPRGFDLVISDIRMPGGSGLDFANELETMRPGTPILYMSGLVDSIAVDAIIKRDPEAMLTKPFTADQLLERVWEILGVLPDRNRRLARGAQKHRP